MYFVWTHEKADYESRGDLVFGRDVSSSDLLETIQSSFQAAKVIQFWPIISILVMRLSRTIQELMASGALSCGRKPLLYSGGGWVLQLFFLVMLAPFIADKSPNPWLD